MPVAQLCGSLKLSAITAPLLAKKRNQISTDNKLPHLHKRNDTFFTPCSNFRPKGESPTTIFGTMDKSIKDFDFMHRA